MGKYKFWKIIFDCLLAIILLILLFPLLILCFFISMWTTRANGIFSQLRIGKDGKPFKIYKLRTIHPKTLEISRISRFLRKSKMDELPQLLNILKGEMSFVGPRPDIPGYYDRLEGEQRKILKLRPGLTSEASIKYRNEEKLLLNSENPLKYNDEVLFPDKVKMNLEYYEKQSFILDCKILWRTFISLFI